MPNVFQRTAKQAIVDDTESSSFFRALVADWDFALSLSTQLTPENFRRYGASRGFSATGNHFVRIVTALYDVSLLRCMR